MISFQFQRWGIEHHAVVVEDNYLEFQKWICVIFLLVAACYDLRFKKVPWTVLGSGIIMAIVLQCFDMNQNILEKILAFIPGMITIVVSWITKESIGYADGLGILVLGILMGARHCVFVICISLFILSLLGMLLLLIRKANRKTRIPYFPFLFLVEITILVFHIN